MIARFILLTLASLCCAARFCAGDADDVVMNQQVKQCAAAIKNDLQAAIANDKDCTEISKECSVVSSTTPASLNQLRCGRVISQGTVPGSELKAKLICPGEHGAATSTDLKQRLCFAAQLSTNTKDNGKTAMLPMLKSNTPSSEFVEGLIAAASVDEVAPDAARLATFLGQAQTSARRLCKKYVVSCNTSPASEQLKAKIESDGCHWHTDEQRSHVSGLWSNSGGVLVDVKHTESIAVDLIDLAIRFKLQHPTARLAKIMSSIDSLHCGSDKSVVGKKSFEGYASALEKVASKMKPNV